MVDFLSRYRLYGLGYTAPTVRQSVPTHRELYHETSRHVHKSHEAVPVHDCRAESMKEITDPRDWEAQLLSHGLRNTFKSVDGLHSKGQEMKTRRRQPDKMLFKTGIYGFQDGDFKYPRGLIATLDSDIIIADSRNHRIQILNQCGVFKLAFGRNGKKPGEFNEPTGVAELPNGDLAVTDRRNKRVQVFTQEGEFKYEFPTVHEPYGIASDHSYNIIVSTVTRTVEVYRRVGKLLHRFDIGGKSKSTNPVQICTNNKDEVIVCDPADSYVKYFSFDGRLLYKFQPVANGRGLAVAPGGICLNAMGEVLVADRLNHTVNLYTERGVLLQQLLCPLDDTGAIHSISCSPEGHLVATEFSVGGEHCVKIFRYRECACHWTRPPSSKRRTPTHFL